ncbi:GNAT family N-acetyltransferase [Micromonospora sp. NBC_01796]|uniref:GNAT family N-acetyltransferase n=1 Tax=Micromonospora sp. NBC_01796 TaxID=2975987 RepID=UPI002DD7CAC7|nr:N-acetyltransferase [Micromonospora sp. NBC_01796]WSA88514.1 N-acetyltransferase [Micromonospora sp. NBC_01796]
MTTVRLRPEGPADEPAIRRVVAAAFAAPDRPVPAEVRLVEALRDSDAWLPELSMVAEVDGDVVGYALLTRVMVQPGAVPALALGPVAVLPKRRGVGYGTDVVQAALAAATELGERLVVVLGDPAYYRRFGFVPAARYELTSPWSGLGAPWQALLLPPSVSGDGAVLSGEVNYPLPWSRV